jgi:hypothetical protein
LLLFALEVVMRPLLFLALLASFAWALPVEARFDARLSWRTMETEHFRVHYHNGLEAIAPRAAEIAEEAHRQLAPALLWQPADKTELVLADVSDLPNGMATPFPYNRIVIYLTPPLEQPFSLTGQEDWLRLVIVHEYTHILHLDAAHRLPAWLRRILGRVYFPNAFQPQWLIEGLATYQETALTDGGRGRASYTDMVLRMAILDGPFPTLAQASVFQDRWPAGEVPYLFGAKFFDYLIEKHGPQLPGEINRIHAGRPVPYLIDSTARLAFGGNYRLEWRHWQRQLRERYRRQQEEIGATTALIWLSDEGHRHFFPAVSPSGRLVAYAAQTADRVPSLLLRDLQSGTAKVLLRRLVAPAAAAIAWLPDESALVYAKLERDRQDNFFHDLFRLDLLSGKEERLTRGLRAGSPDISPASGDIVCTIFAGGRNRLALLAGDGGLRRWLSADHDRSDYSTPRWSPDGRQLAVAVREGDRFAIRILSADGRPLHSTGPPQAINTSPAWSTDGQRVFFTSDASGIFNIFAYYPEGGQLEQISQVLGGAFSPAATPDGDTLIVSAYRGRGFDLAALSMHGSVPHPFTPPRVDTPELTEPIHPGEERDEPQGPSVTMTGKYPSRPYSAGRSLLPRYWFPLTGSDEHSWQIGAMTSGHDPLERHAYAASLLVGVESGRPAYSLLYRYNGLTPTVQAFIADQPLFYADFYRHPDGREFDFWERRRSIGLDLLVPFPGLWDRHELQLGYRGQRFHHLDALALQPQAAEGDLSGVRLAYLFDNSVRPPRAISAEDGRRLQLAVQRDDAALGSDFDRTRYSLDWQEFTVVPWGRHQVLASRFFAGLADGDLIPQGAFRIGGDTFGDLLLGLDDEYLPLRGYESNALRGQRALLGSLEYRFPIAELDRGPGNGQFYLRRVHGAVFYEGAQAFDRGRPRLAHFRTAAGLEARLDADLGYFLPLTLRVVLARGFDEGGETQGYISLWLRF